MSSNGRTRDFGSLYHGSNPCAPTKNSTGFYAGLIFGRARIRQSEAHGEYADEQLTTAQKRIFLIEFLPSGWLLFIKVSCALQRVLKKFLVGASPRPCVRDRPQLFKCPLGHFLLGIQGFGKFESQI